MDGGDAPHPDEADEPNEAGSSKIPATAESLETEVAVAPTVESTGWEINWPGVAGLAAVLFVLLIAWSQFGGDSDGDVAIGGVDSVAEAVVLTSTSTTSVSATSTLAPTTTAPATTTTVAKRRVIASGEIKPCRFGDRCIAISFVIEGFDQHPGNFTCIYPNSTSNFGFNDNDVIDACLSGDSGDTITIEVDGVRSAPISSTNLDGTG